MHLWRKIRWDIGYPAEKFRPPRLEPAEKHYLTGILTYLSIVLKIICPRNKIRSNTAQKIPVLSKSVLAVM